MRIDTRFTIDQPSRTECDDSALFPEQIVSRALTEQDWESAISQLLEAIDDHDFKEALHLAANICIIAPERLPIEVLEPEFIFRLLRNLPEFVDTASMFMLYIEEYSWLVLLQKYVCMPNLNSLRRKFDNLSMHNFIQGESSVNQSSVLLHSRYFKIIDPNLDLARVYGQDNLKYLIDFAASAERKTFSYSSYLESLAWLKLIAPAQFNRVVISEVDRAQINLTIFDPSLREVDPVKGMIPQLDDLVNYLIIVSDRAVLSESGLELSMNCATIATELPVQRAY